VETPVVETPVVETPVKAPIPATIAPVASQTAKERTAKKYPQNMARASANHKTKTSEPTTKHIITKIWHNKKN